MNNAPDVLRLSSSGFSSLMRGHASSSFTHRTRWAAPLSYLLCTNTNSRIRMHAETKFMGCSIRLLYSLGIFFKVVGAAQTSTH